MKVYKCEKCCRLYDKPVIIDYGDEKVRLCPRCGERTRAFTVEVEVKQKGCNSRKTCALCGDPIPEQFEQSMFGGITLLNKRNEKIPVCEECHRAVHALCDRDP